MRARYVQEAIPFVRSRMAGEEPFPTNKEQLSSVLQGALLDSHREHSVIANREIPEGTDFLVTFAEFWLLLSSIRVINVELQGLARKLVKKHYGFEDPETTANAGAASTRNKNMVPVLLRSSSRYMFHGRQDDSDRVSPLTSRQYLHPILEEFVLRAWFDQGSNSAGFRAPRRFDIGGVPLTTIAFVMSVIAAAVSEWSTGSCEPVDFLIHPGLAIKQNFHNSHTTLKLWEEQLLQSNSPVTYSALRTSMLQNVISDRRGAAASSDRRAR